MSTVLIIHAEGRKRPLMLPWATAPFPGLPGASVNPTIGMELHLPQFKNPFFKVERVLAMHNPAIGGAFAGHGSFPGAWGSGVQYASSGAYGPRPAPNDDDPEDLSPEPGPMVQFAVMVIARQCEPFDIPGLPGLTHGSPKL